MSRLQVAVCCFVAIWIVQAACASNFRRCTPGKWYLHDDGCNSCMCDMTGKGMDRCTYKDCKRIIFRLKREYCMPNMPFVTADRCYKCKCDEKGKSGLCVPITCSRSPENFRAL